MSDRLRMSRPATISFLVVLALSTQGCWILGSGYPSPPRPLKPAIAGVIAEARVGPGGWTVKLQDGRRVFEPQDNSFLIVGDTSRPGSLLLAKTGDGGFAVARNPLVSLGSLSAAGCWEGWEAPERDRIVWDMGDSILFGDGLELPKAPGYTTNLEPHDVDGNLAWTNPRTDVGQIMSFCVSDKGEFEWAHDWQT